MSRRDEAGWDGLDALWRTQTLAEPDIARLRRDARRGRRREIWLSMLDIASFAIAVGVVGHFVADSGTTRAAAAGMGVLALGALFTAWSVWNRRASWRRVALAPQALLAAETLRALAARRFWRVNTRVMLGLAAMLALLAFSQTSGWIDGLRPERWWLPAVGNAPLVIASLLWARRRDRQLRERLDRLEALRRQLAD